MSPELALEMQGEHERRWKQYPAYRDSRVEWLGDVPKGWKTKKVKHTTYVKGRIGWQGLRSDEFIDEGPYLVTGTDFVDGKVDWGTCYHVSRERYDEDPYIQLRENDLLITKDGTIGKTSIVKDLPDTACLNSGIFLTRPISGDYITEFMYWLLNSVVFIKFIDYTKTGATINHLYQNIFVEFVFPVPNIPEQRIIAAFLDRETAKIDALAAKKERLVELLEEKRTALISHAVTKGLDPDAPMKDSGIEWLGEVPAHWAKMRIKHLLHQIIDTAHKTAPYSPDGNYLVVRTSNVRNGILSFDDAKYTDNEGFKEWTRRGVPKPDDILFTREAPAGEACIVPDNVPLCIGQRMVLFRVNKQRLDARFGIYSIYGGLADEFIRSLSQGSTVGHFNMSDIGNTPLFEPSLSKQHTIAAFLDHETSKIDKLTKKIYEQIDKLKEYRTALISAAVTGKIDVRGEIP